ncbi:MAG: YwaF family protein [Clostridia bacterium]|nr:YwaF family protein [Clostridia bacterium]
MPVENVKLSEAPERDKILKAGLNRALKACTVILLVCGFLSTLTVSDYYIFNRFGEFYKSFIISQWVKKCGYVLFPMAIFLNRRSAADVAKYFLPIFIVISAFLYGDFFSVTMATEGASAATMIYAGINEFMPEWVVRMLYYLENGLMAILCVGLFVRDGYKIYPRSFILAPVTMILMMPLNIFENFYDAGSIASDSILNFGSFTIWHFLALLYLAGLTIGVYYLLKHRSEKDKWDILRYLALVMVWQYCSRNSMLMGDGYNVYHTIFTAFPLYICNIGVFIALIAVFTKKRVFLSMAFFIHAAGALTMFVYFGRPEMSNYGIFCSYTTVYLVVTHAWLFVLCVMPAALGLYKWRPKDAVIPLIYYLVFIILATVVSGVITSYSMTLSYNGVYLTEDELIVPNYSFTQIDPLPIYNPPNIPFTIWKYEFNLFYLIFLYLFYVAIFYTFNGLYYLFSYCHKRFINRRGTFMNPAPDAPGDEALENAAEIFTEDAEDSA